ncbi:MAG: rod shape-determining protein RodA [Methylophilaceae bacterium]
MIRRYFDALDIPLIFLILIIILIGIITLFSASSGSLTLIGSQLSNVLIGLLLLIFLANSQTQKIIYYAPYLYAFSLITLILVNVMGFTSHGAQRWINLGFINFQPSELMKIALPLFISWIYHYQKNENTYKIHFLAMFAILLPCFLIIKQPDLGTAIVISLSGLIIIFLAGLSWRFILGSLFVSLMSIPFLWSSLHTYQQNRVLTLFEPFKDPLGSGYHTIQSMIAIGSGGFFGKGWANGTQTNLNFLPETTTDFIFSVYAEEFGFIGILFIFILYFLVLYRIFYLAIKMQNTFSRLVTISLGITIFFNIIINIGMISGIMPIVGIPLPFMSYGGTSMVVSLASIGIIMSLYFKKTLIAN